MTSPSELEISYALHRQCNELSATTFTFSDGTCFHQYEIDLEKGQVMQHGGDGARVGEWEERSVCGRWHLGISRWFHG